MNRSFLSVAGKKGWEGPSTVRPRAQDQVQIQVERLVGQGEEEGGNEARAADADRRPAGEGRQRSLHRQAAWMSKSRASEATAACFWELASALQCALSFRQGLISTAGPSSYQLGQPPTQPYHTSV